mgnify:CR=1 FL=1
MLSDIGENRTLLRAILLLVIVGTIPFYICGIVLWGVSRDPNAPTATPSEAPEQPTSTWTPLGLDSNDDPDNARPSPTPLDGLPPTFTPFVPIDPTPGQFFPLVPTAFPTNPPPVVIPPTDTPVPTFTPIPSDTPTPTSTPTDPPPQATNTLLPFDPLSPTPIDGRSNS